LSRDTTLGAKTLFWLPMLQDQGLSQWVTTEQVFEILTAAVLWFQEKADNADSAE
jgi:hypothetical protein